MQWGVSVLYIQHTFIHSGTQADTPNFDQKLPINHNVHIINTPSLQFLQTIWQQAMEYEPSVSCYTLL
jgi:hypothetical protein